MKYLTLATIVLATTIGSAASAFDDNDVARLKNTKECTDCDLSGAMLLDADLTGADLRGSDLSGADLRNGSLRGANLQASNLSGADLRNSDLTGANLRDANLDGATLRNAKTAKTLMNGVILCNTTLPSDVVLYIGCR